MRSLGIPLYLAAALVAVLCAVGCSDSGKSDNETKTESSLAGALTKGVKFKDGLIKHGAIGKPASDADRVKLSSTLKAMAMKPGGAAIMALGVDNPDADDNAAVATLMQFEDAEDHIEVPIDDNASQVDGGASEDAVEVMNPWECTQDICEQLCNRKFFTHVTIAIRLEDGSISEHKERDVVLDCTKDGDPKLCKPGDDGGSQPDAASSSDDAGAGNLTDASVPGDGGAASDAALGDAGGLPPVIGLINPLTTVAGMTLTVSVSGSGFTEEAVVVVDGTAVATEFDGGNALTATVPAALTMQPGSLAIYVENVAGNARTRSNTLYLQVDPVPGAPLIYDYSPDNGVPGDTILIIASNLAGQTLEITDAEGHELTPGALGTKSWPTVGSVDTVEVELPSNIATGPITVANAMGAFKGKIFSVGRNLTRLDGTEITFSSQYNTTGTWSHESGADNQLATSYFTAHGDCASLASCTTKPWFMVTFPSGQAVSRIAIRGNREYASGYDFLTAKFELLDADADVMWQGTYDLPAPDRDLDIVLPKTFDEVSSVRFSSLADESDEPGFAELEVFGP